MPARKPAEATAPETAAPVAPVVPVNDPAAGRLTGRLKRLEYLQGMLDGTVQLLSEGVFATIVPMFTRYVEGSEMYVLLAKAATGFGEAVQEVAACALASWAIDDARRRARDTS